MTSPGTRLSELSGPSRCQCGLQAVSQHCGRERSRGCWWGETHRGTAAAWGRGASVQQQHEGEINIATLYYLYGTFVHSMQHSFRLCGCLSLPFLDPYTVDIMLAKLRVWISCIISFLPVLDLEIIRRHHSSTFCSLSHNDYGASLPFQTGPTVTTETGVTLFHFEKNSHRKCSENSETQ